MNLKDRKINLEKDSKPSSFNKRAMGISKELNGSKTSRLKGDNNNSSFIKRKLKFLLHHKVLAFLVLFLFICGFVYQVNLNQFRKAGWDFGFFGPIGSIGSVLSKPNKDAIRELNNNDNRTNFLLLGIDKREEDNSLLTDSIMVLSLNHNTNEVAQISVPRDLDLQYKIEGNNYSSKINAVFTNGYNAAGSDKDGDKYDAGFKALGDVLTEITGLPIHYGSMVDFNGLKDLVDNLGGVEVDVERDFIDCLYPNDNFVSEEEAFNSKVSTGCDVAVDQKQYSDYPNDPGYMALSFNKGLQQMDGATALNYARSRHSFDVAEGTDFARAKRQQKVVQAIKNKAANSDLIKKANGISDIPALIGNNMRFYNMKENELKVLVKAREILGDISTYSMVIDPNFGSYTNQLITGKYWEEYGNAYLILPNKEDYSEVNQLVKFYLDNTFLLKDSANISVGYSSSSRYAEYLRIKEEVFNKRLKVNFIDSQIKSTITGNASITPELTTGNVSEKSKISIYKLTEGKDSTLEFYKKLLSEQGFEVLIKNSENLSEAFVESMKDQDFAIVLE